MNIVRAMPANFLGCGNPRKVWQRNLWTGARRNFTTGLVLFLTALLAQLTVADQAQQYAVATGEYVLDLPSAQWGAITVSGENYPRNFRFNDDNGIARLRIRREIVKNEGVSTTDVAERQRRLDRSARRGYVPGRVESFTGAMSGTK